MVDKKVIYDDRIPRIREQKRKEKTNKKFILLFLLFFFIVISILYLQSPLAKLSEITIEGNRIVDTQKIVETSGLHIGMPYFNISSQALREELQTLEEIDHIEMKRILPNQLLITVTEHPVVAFWVEDQQLFPILKNGHISLSHPWQGHPVEHPLLTGWPHKEGLIELAGELHKLSPVVRLQISEITLTPTLSDPYRLRVYMIDGYEVRTSIRYFAENVNMYPQLMEQARSEGKEGGIFYLLDGKWYEEQHQSEEKDEEEESIEIDEN